MTNRVKSYKMTGDDSGQVWIRNKGIFFEMTFDLKLRKTLEHEAIRWGEAFWAEEMVSVNAPEWCEIESTR